MFLPTSPRPPSGMIRMLIDPSWHQAVPVTREERRLVEVRREGLDIEAAGVERCDVVLVAMQPLAAGDDLEPPVEEVETARPLGPLGVGMRVERTLGRREALDEDQLAVVGADAAL